MFFREDPGNVSLSLTGISLTAKICAYERRDSMRKRIIPCLLFCLLLSMVYGCSPKKEVYQAVYLDVFDTVTTIRGYDISQEVFNKNADKVHSELLEYHRLFDIYHDCPGGIKEVNDQAGLEPVIVDPRVMELLKDCITYCKLSNNRVNPAMGSVLSLWHEARENGTAHPEAAELPDISLLEAAADHTDMNNLILDETNGTAFLSDPLQKLDVGAVAKGWTAEKASGLLPDGYMLNLGGNVRTIGTKPDGTNWNIGIQSPDDPAAYVGTVSIHDMSLVTSGDYQRSYTVDGVNYHHIIDPDTLMPSKYWRSVSILKQDSGLSDLLSTALFLMPLEEGKALAEKCGAEALWIAADGTQYQTDGFNLRK